MNSRSAIPSCKSWSYEKIASWVAKENHAFEKTIKKQDRNFFDVWHSPALPHGGGIGFQWGIKTEKSSEFVIFLPNTKMVMHIVGIILCSHHDFDTQKKKVKNTENLYFLEPRWMSFFLFCWSSTKSCSTQINTDVYRFFW